MLDLWGTSPDQSDVAYDRRSGDASSTREGDRYARVRSLRAWSTLDFSVRDEHLDEKKFFMEAAGMVEGVTGQRPIGYNCNWRRFHCWRCPTRDTGKRQRLVWDSATIAA